MEFEIMKNNCWSLKVISFFGIVAAVSLAAFADGHGESEEAVHIIRSGIPHDALYALEMDGKWGLAVGNFGLMLETSDGGESWTLVPPVKESNGETLKSALLAVARDGENVILTGQQGLVVTRQGSADWEVQDSGLDARLLNVDIAGGLTMAVGEFGFIGRSVDGGKSWKQVSVNWERFNDEGYEPHLYDVVIQANGVVLIAGEFGLILRSTDGGMNFDAANRGEQSVFDIHLAEDGTRNGFAVGQEGLVLKTSDAGASWTKLAKATNANLLGVWSGHDEVVITGIRELLRSSDGGSTFQSGQTDIQIGRNWFQGVASGTAEKNSGVGVLAEESVYIVGHQGSIARIVK